MSVVTIERKVLEKNDALASQNRARFRERGLFVFNLVSSPGSGKTSLLEQTIVEIGPSHFNPFRQHERPLELAGGDAAMEEHPRRVVGLLAAHRQLVLDQLDHQVVDREPGDGQGDAQPVLANPLDVVRRVALGVLGQSVQGALELVEAQQQGRIEHRYATHKTLLRGASGREPN